ncbi:MAG: hypothetical protein AMK73_04500 [Planctomycetes bacterium SM23_32]|nr:MAG: hypothetical protein AMK73_04500 [Planctomycetes bacterium SM23_32]
MQEKMAGKAFGALLLAAFLGGICSHVVVSVVGGTQAEAAEAAATPAAGLTEVRATALIIVGEDGVERARLGAYEGGYGLVVRDAAGVARAILSLVEEEKGVALALHDDAGLRRFYMGPGPDGGGFEILDPRGNRRFGFGEGPDSGAFQIGDPQGNVRLSFGEGRNGGAFQVRDPRGKTRFSFGEAADGGGVQVFDAAGKKRFEVSEAGNDGGIKMFDSAGNKRFEVFDGAGWLGATFLDSAGVERSGVRMGPDGESDFFITGGLTEWKASTCLQVE